MVPVGVGVRLALQHSTLEIVQSTSGAAGVIAWRERGSVSVSVRLLSRLMVGNAASCLYVRLGSICAATL
jgi:hypothetical protein